jgi:c(7)-type cytochrome triheme protein
VRAARGSGWLAGAAVALASAVALGAVLFPAVLRIPRKHPHGPAVPPLALFSHRSHESFGCYACHPSLFPQALVGFTHAEMQQGRFCGRCHDGGSAFAIQGAPCARCHVDGP